MATAIEGSAGSRHDASKSVTRIALHQADLRHRIAYGKTAPQPGADQEIPLADVGSSGHVMDFQAAERASALGNRPHSVAVDLDKADQAAQVVHDAFELGEE